MFYVGIVVPVIFLSSRTLVPNIGEAFREAIYFNVTLPSISECVPMILFAYMYQVNIPMIYYELERRDRRRMKKVVTRGSIAGVILYASVGLFGYLTFVKNT